MWLPKSYLESINITHLLPYDRFEKLLDAAPKSGTALDCPAGCGQLADVSRFDPVISCCGKCHGIWFDRGELKDFLSQIPDAGGPYSVLDADSGSILPAYQIPPRIRGGMALSSLFLILYGAHGVWVNDLYIPGKRGAGVHFPGIAMWFTFGAMVFATMNAISLLLDHFDSRDNRKSYLQFARATTVVAWYLLITGLVIHFWALFSTGLHH